MTLDPSTHDLLAAIRDLDVRTRELPERERSLALAHLGGVMRSMLGHGVESRHATAAIAAWTPMREWVG